MPRSRGPGMGTCDDRQVQATYWDPERDAVVETDISANDLGELVRAVLGHRSGRGHPALEITRPDDSLVVLGTDGQRAVINWINALGESFRSVGEGNDSRVLVFDYFGSWSEAPGSALVDLQDAARCLERFVMTGAPDTESVLFAPE